MLTLVLTGNTRRMNAALYDQYFSEKTIISKPLDSKLSNDKKEKILTWRSTLLKQVKTYIDNNLNSVRLNVINLTKDNFSQPPSVIEILDELEISKGDNYRALSITKDKDLKLQLKIHLLIIILMLICKLVRQTYLFLMSINQ